ARRPRAGAGPRPAGRPGRGRVGCDAGGAEPGRPNVGRRRPRRPSRVSQPSIDVLSVRNPRSVGVLLSPSQATASSGNRGTIEKEKKKREETGVLFGVVC